MTRPEPVGGLALVLHAHLPFVRHPEYAYHLEENWLYEAVAATYLPLLDVFRGLRRDAVGGRLTMTMSPPLTTMLRDELLRTRARAYLERLVALGDQELERNRDSDTFRPIVEMYLERFTRLRDLWDEIGGDVAGAFGELEDAGHLEIVTVGATHGYLPAVREPAARRAQIQIAAESHRRTFGRSPRGIWLPECGYAAGVEDYLAEAGIRFFFVDTHGLTHARPRPPYGTAAPVYARNGVAAFGRDPASSKQVWSADEGYPGDPDYRDFYRDVGFDRPLVEIAPFIHPDGIRIHTGYKYYRVTGKVDLAVKQPYVPAWAREKAAAHARHFLASRRAQARGLAAQMEPRPLIVAPYDAELYGHWWFEGPMFLDFLLRQAWYDQAEIALETPSDYLARNPTLAVADISPSSWGDGGFSAVWIDGVNDWIYRHQHRAETTMVELARRYAGSATPLEERVLDQAARELVLLQASDWAFILKMQTATGYATSRVKAHVARFRRLVDELTTGKIDEGWLADLEARDNLFPEMDFRVYAA
ncbi:MAG TPA: 1,4-alpha-glucan branching protein domain-containing protein [Haliangiales bacterium]|nr:1,4-alpha-glucan branching protein domain-containing protein [Haliangiales bacterium]